LSQCPPSQTFPQAPQFFGSLSTLVQLENSPVPHAVSGAVHDAAWQAPLAQLCPALQAWPQEPQLAWSVETSTQLPPQTVPFAPTQVLTQAPVAQACPLAHAVPQAPQFWGSFWVSTQAPLQAIWFEAQETAPEELAPLPPPELLEPEPAVEELQAAATSAVRRHRVFVEQLGRVSIIAGSCRPNPGPRGRANTKQSPGSQIAM
jgi:hypothetical protein